MDDDQIGEIKSADHMVSFAWTFDWALCQVKKSGESIKSPSFSTLMPDLTLQEWRLQLYPDGANRKCRGNLSIHLYTVNGKQPANLLKVVTFHLKSNSDEELFRNYGKPHAKLPLHSCQDQFVSKQVIENGSNNLLHYGKLTIVCTMMEVWTDLKYGFARKLQEHPEIPSPPVPLPRTRSLNNLVDSDDDDDDVGDQEEDVQMASDPFEALLVSGKSDVRISAGPKAQVFHAHRAILAARSPFFQRIFEQDLIQRKRISFIDMGEFGVDVVVELLRYVYLDRVGQLSEQARVLLAPANKYALEKLKVVCEAVMIEQLNVENASEYLVLSFLHEASKLQKRAMDFVASHSLDVLSTPGFKAIAGSHANVITALLKTVVIKGQEE